VIFLKCTLQLIVRTLDLANIAFLTAIFLELSAMTCAKQCTIAVLVTALHCFKQHHASRTYTSCQRTPTLLSICKYLAQQMISDDSRVLMT
jgi:hypothetical protein